MDVASLMGDAWTVRYATVVAAAVSARRRDMLPRAADVDRTSELALMVHMNVANGGFDAT